MAWGGDHKGERVIDIEGEIDRDYLFMLQDRLRQVGHLRELIADFSEKIELAKVSRSGNDRRAEGGLARGVDDLLVQWEELYEKYVGELGEVMRMVQRVEEWMEKLTPRQKELVRYRHFLGHTMIETAEYFGVAPVTIWSWETKMFK